MNEPSKFEFEPQDLEGVTVLFEETDEPQTLAIIIDHVLGRKKAAITSKRIKAFDPRCEYEIGDLILKKYDEVLRAGKTRTVLVKEAVLLEVKDKFRHSVLPCTMLEVGYDGAGPFKLHTDFLSKIGAKLFVPCGQSDPPMDAWFVEEAEDPRLKTQEPTPEDIAAFTERLTDEVGVSPAYFCWKDNWYLAERKIEINPAIIHRAEKLIKERGVSVSCEDLLTEIFATSTGDVKFSSFAISFNHTLESIYRKKFVCVSFKGWGRWNLLENLEAKKNATRGLSERLEDFVETITGEEEILARRRERLSLPFLGSSDLDSIRFCLSFRDIIGGALRPVHVPDDFFEEEREIPVRLAGQHLMVDYFPEFKLLLGFGDLFTGCRQADLLSMRREGGEYSLAFEPAASPADGTDFRYDERRDLIVAGDEPARSAHEGLLEATVTAAEIQKIEPLQPDVHRRRDLYEAVAKLFHALGDSKKGFPLNILKLYHLLDTLAFVPWEKFLHLLLSYPAFYQTPEDLQEAVFRLDLTKVSFDLGARASVPAHTQVAVPAPAAPPAREETPPAFGLFAEKLQAALGTDRGDRKRGKPPK